MLSEDLLCENKTIHASNGINYIVCIPWSTTSLGRIYSWPLEIKVSGGTLKRSQVVGGIVYNFFADPINIVNGNGKKIIDIKSDKDANKKGDAADDQWIEGIDNTYVILGVLAAFLLFKN
jgi:hypothetical protein